MRLQENENLNYKKWYSFSIYIFLIIILSSCEPPVVFDQPYPLNTVDLDAIPDQFLGVYLCESDSNLVYIDEQSIVLESYRYFKSHISKITEKENCSIKDNQMILPGNNECIPLTYLNDTIVKGMYTVVDTLFKNKEKAKARMYKGHLVLSTKVKKNEWIIHSLSPDNENLYYRSIVDKSRLDEIEKITPMQDITKSDSNYKKYRIKPSMSEFDELFKNNKIFIDCEYLKSVKLEYSPIHNSKSRLTKDLEF